MQAGRQWSFYLSTLLTLTPTAAVLAAESAAQSGEQATRTEHVIVTASRVAEDGRRLPLAWSSVDQQALATVSPVHINEIMQQVPGAWISRGNGQESLISLRSPVLTGPGSCGAFLTASDGIGLRAPGFCNVNQLFDANVEQAGGIEVINGPATALYGSNAMHGVINILSAAPTLEREQQLALEAGPDDYYRARYHYSDSSGAHGVRVALNAATDGGYKDSSGFEQFKATLRHDYDGDDWQVRTVFDASELDQETAGFIEGFKSYADDALKDSNPNPDAYRDAWSWRLYSRFSLDLDRDTTFVLTPYLRDNKMEFLQHFLPWNAVEKNAHSSLGVRGAMHNQSTQWRWVTGLDLEYTDASLQEVQAEPFSANQPAGVHYDYNVGATVAALFGQLRSQWQSPWELSAGVRFEHSNYDYNNRAGDGAACGPDADNCRFFRPADREDDFNEWSLNVGVSYELTANTLSYLRLARGFRAPQATELYRLQAGQESADLDAEEIDNIELGLRGNWSGRAGYQLSVYYMEKSEVVFQDADRQNVAGADTEHYGAELSLQYKLGKNWSLAADASLARHRYASDADLLGSSGAIEGNDIDTAPKAFGSARINWDLTALTGRDGNAELEWVYMGDYYLEPDNEHEYDGHSLLNLRVSTRLWKNCSAALRVTNLLDEDYAERADFGFGNYRYFVGQPRGIYGQITLYLP